MKPPSPALPLMDELLSIKNYLIAAQEILQSGHMPDITSLEPRVANLCQNIEALPKEDRTPYLAEMTLTLGKLNELEADMKVWNAKKAT